MRRELVVRDCAKLVRADEPKTIVNAPIGRDHGRRLTGAFQRLPGAETGHPRQGDLTALWIQKEFPRAVREDVRPNAAGIGIRGFGTARVDRDRHACGLRRRDAGRGSQACSLRRRDAGNRWRVACRGARHRKEDQKGETEAHRASVHPWRGRSFSCCAHTVFRGALSRRLRDRTASPQMERPWHPRDRLGVGIAALTIALVIP
jgi:hypothetical protein